MPYLNAYVVDNGLSVLAAETEELHICSSEPASYAAAMLNSLGQKASPPVNSPSDEVGYIRAVVVDAISDGAVDAAGTAAAWAMVDVTNTRLLAAGPLDAPVDVEAGVFALTSFSIRINDFS